MFLFPECRQAFSDDDSEEEEEPLQHRQDAEQEQNEDGEMQLNLDADERFVLPSGQEIEKDILPLSGCPLYSKMGIHACLVVRICNTNV